MEIRTFREGELRWAEASGTGGWVTASGAATGQIGYVQPGLGFTIQHTYQTIFERGTSMHHKWMGINAPELTFTVLYGLTAQYPPKDTAMYHFELRSIQPENPAIGSIYTRFHNCVLTNRQFTEAENGNTLRFTYKSLDISDPTGVGMFGV